MKRLISTCILLLSLAASLSADRYKIISVIYNIRGITRQYALEQAVDIDTDRVFESYNDLNLYIKNITQLFNNERNLTYAIVNASYDPITYEDGITKVTLNVSTQDSKHFLVLPYPKYNSNDGFILKLKAKDTNFLGTMETLNCDINFSIEPTKDNPDEYDTIFGVNFNYNYPFKMWKFDSKWNNDFSIDYTIGKDTPEYQYTTGFTFSLPFKNFSVQLDLSQAITKNFDYIQEDDPSTPYDESYDDQLYFTENAQLSIPFKVARIDNFADVTWSPFVAYEWNWDQDGISEYNEDLSSPTLKVGYTTSTGRTNWYGNFRTGVDMTMTQYTGYNYQIHEYLASISGTLKAFKAFKYIGLCSRFYGFYNLENEKTSVGSYLRGIRDDQKYKGSQLKALSTHAAIVGNIDIPIHIITTNWVGMDEFIFGQDSWMTNHLRWMRYFDFELQMAVFGDFAFTHNEITDKTFAIKDGWYAGGVEVLVYPAKWRSLVVRASAGMDAGRKIVNKVVSKLFDNSWRRQVSALEISIGIGLHY